MATLEELQLNGFSTVGNIYVDSSYTAEATPATDPITGEALVFDTNAFGAIAGGTVSAVPADGSALFVTNVDGVGNFYNGRAGSTEVYDVYASGVTGLTGMYVLPRAAGTYTPDANGDGTLNVFVENSTFASGGYHGFGATTGGNFTGDYALVIKNTSMQYLAVSTGSAYGDGEGNAGNHRYAKIDGDITFTLDNVTVSSVAGVARGQVGTDENHAKITGVIKDSKFGNIFQVLHQGVDASGGSYKSWTDLDITVTGTSVSGAFMMLPNQSSATRSRNGELNFTGNIKLKMTGSTVNGLVIGTGRSGTGWQRVGWIFGDIDFELAGSTTGTTFVTKGNMGDSSHTQNVTGVIKDGSVLGNVVVFENRDNATKDLVYADSDIQIIGSTFGKFEYVTTINSSGNTLSNADKLYGSETLELTGVRGGDIISSTAAHSGATFTLNFHASETQSVVGTINTWKTMTVDAGASVRANGITNVESVTVNGANLLSAGTVSGISTLTVTDATLTKGDAILISGLNEYAESSIETVIVNGTEFGYGFFGGQYEFVGGNLVAHLDPTYLVNNNYDGNNVATGFEGVKGYKDLDVAQTAAKANGASLIISNLDDTVSAPTFTADVATLDVLTKITGQDSYYLSLDDVSIVIGDTAADVATANVNIAYANNINSIKFGNITESASVSVSESGKDDAAIGTLDLTGAVLTGADIAVSDSVIGDVKLDNQAANTGKVTISNSTITNVIGAAGGLTIDMTGANEIENVYADGNGAKIKLGTSTVKTYLAGSAENGKVIETLVYNDGVSAEQLIIGGNANQIGKVEATVTGGDVQTLIVGNDGDTVAGDVDLNLAGGTFDSIKIAESATVGGKINVELSGGTVDTVNGTFYGLVYGASVTNALDGGSQGTERNLVVNGYARVGSIVNFGSIEVLGGTLNVESGDRKSDPSAENMININGDILNRRAIQAGAIVANDLNNYGLIGVLRKTDEDPGIVLNGDFLSTNFVRTSVLSVAGNFSNSGEITSVGDITVGGTFSNSGQIYIRSSFDRVTSVFTQDGGIALGGVDMVNTGDAAFISTGFLTGVKNLTTNRLYVTGGAEINGNITIEAGAEVAFTNKAVKDPASEFAVNGLKLTGKIAMYDTSNLIVSGTLTSGSKTITVNTEGEGLVGSNVLVRAEAGVDSWTINWGEGLSDSSYGVIQSSSEIILYSVGELFVNSDFASYEEGDSVIINGKTFLFGYNAFATVEDATYFATQKGFTTSRIAILNDATGMDVDAEGFDVELINSTVGTVTAKGIFVESDSKIATIAAATAGLTIDADAVLTITDAVPADLAVVIDASEGSGARKVLSFDPSKVEFSEGQVTVQAPVGNTSYTAAIAGGDVFLKADANIFLFAADAEIVDGTVDNATGDVLFAGVNAFTDEAAAAAAANAAGATLYIADGSNKIRAIEGVSSIAIEYSGASDVYGSDGDAFVSDQDYSVQIAGVTSSAKVYGLNKSVNMSGDYTFVMTDSNLTNAQSAIYIVGNDVNNVVNGNIKAELTNVRTVGRQDVPWGNGGWNEGIYLGYGSFGTDPNAPIDIDVTLRNVTASNSGFYGIQTQPSDGTRSGADDTSTSSTPKEQQVRQDINANINIKVYDSVIGGTFTVLNTNNEHWDANGASLLNTYFSSGSITVEVGNSDFGTEGNWRNIRLGASLQLGGKAIQEFNVPNTLHIVATENGTTTRAAYINEWDTLIVDATAQLVLSNEVQYSTVFGPNNPLDDAGELTQIMINMSGYKSGTHNVISAGTSIATDSTLSNITVIGDNDLTGQCQLAYAFSSDGTQLRGIYIFDKADDMYVNATYDNSISGTKVSGQELLLNYNAFTGFENALTYADDWGGTIVVTGGQFASQDFHGNNVEVRGATIDSLTMAADKQSKKEVTLTVKDGAVLGSVDGSNAVTDSSVLEIAGAAQIGDIFDFDTVTVKKGVSLNLGNVAGAGFNMYADNELKAKTVSFTGTEKIVIDVTAYSAKGHAIISTENGITGFDPSMVTLEAHDKGKVKTNLDNYSVFVVGNDLVLRNAMKSDTYLNSEYTAASMVGGVTLADGSYLEYGFNAFDDPTAAAANLGAGSKFTLTVTGGEIAGDIKLGGNNFVMDEGVVDGVVYACVNTADKGGFYSGKTYTVTSGTIGGFDLTAGEGVYTATNSAIKLGEDVTITGNVIGGGDTVVTSEGKFTVGGLIMGVSEIVLNADGFLTAGGINLLSGEGESATTGTIRVKSVPFTSEEGNRRLIIKSDTDIIGAQYVADPGTAVYSTGKEVYVLDLTRVYYDPTFTADIDGTKAANGDTLLWGINAFSSFTSAKGALITGGTLYVSNANTRIGTDDRLINLVITDSNVPVMISGMTSGDKSFTGADAILVIENSTFGQDGESWLLNRVTAGNPWDHHNTIGGNLYVTINNSTIGGNNNQTTHFIDYLSYTGTEMVFDINDTVIRNDLEFFGDSGPLRNGQTITINLTNVTAPANKWWRITSGNPGNAGAIVVNIKDSSIGTSGDMRFGVQSTWQWGTPSATTNITFSVEDSYFSGYLTAHSIDSGRNCTFTGDKTLVISGSSNYVRASVHFSTVSIAATSFVTGSTMSLDDAGLLHVDGAGYEGPTKTLIWMNTTLSGINTIEAENLKAGYAVVKGNKGVVLSDGVIGNLYFDADYSSDITGATSAYGDVLIFQDDAAAVEMEGNALSELETAKGKLTAGNKLFVAANEKTLYGTMDSEEVTPFVNMVVTNGDFSEDGSLIAVADVDYGKSVTGTATLEIAGGSIGKKAVTHVDEETGEVIEDEPAVYASISGDKGNGTKGDLVLSKAGGIYANVSDFATMTVTAESRVHGTITVDALSIDSTGFLTVDTGDLVTDSIHISTAGYEGASKKVLVADALATIDESKITADEGGELFLDRANSTLWLVSQAPGNVYFSTAFDDTINGQTFNGDLLFFDANAFNTISAETIGLRSTSKDTVYVLDGNFGAEVADLSGFGSRKIQLDGGSVGGFKVDAGSAVTLTGATSAINLGSVEGVPVVNEDESVTEGISLTLNSAKAATLNSATGVNNVTINASNAVNLTVGKIDYLENGGALTVDFGGYTLSGAQANLITVAGGINNFIQYIQPEPVEGEDPAPAYSRTTIATTNNGDRLMAYYDETAKAIKVVKRGNAGILDANANNSVNGTSQTVAGVANTLVYGFNISQSLSGLVSGLADGDILVVDGASRDLMVENRDLNAIISNSRIGNIQLGKTNNAGRSGNVSVEITDSTITARSALAGRGTASDSASTRTTLIVGNYDEEAGAYVGSYDFTVKGGAYNDSGSTDNVFCITQYANMAGDTVNVNLEDYTLNCDVHMFDNIWNVSGEPQLKTVNVTMTNVSNTASKWMWIWDPRESNATTINLTITNTSFTSGNRDYTLGLFGDNTEAFAGEANVFINGLTLNGRLSGARGLNTGDVDVAYTDDAKITLHVDGTNDIDLVKMFKRIEIADTGYLTGGTVSLAENNEGIFIIGEKDKDYGKYQTFVNVNNSITGATGVKFVDNEGNEIEGYTAVLGSTNVFIYKPGKLGDVFYSKAYSADVNGQAAENLDGSKTVLVFGDNAVKTVADAYTALEAAAGTAAFRIEGASDKNLYTNGYTTVVNGGNVTNLFGGNAPDETDPENPVAAAAVEKVDITVNKTATVTNLTVATELSQVTGNAIVTITDDVVFNGTIDGGNAFVGGTSNLVFTGAASAGSVVGFDSVTINANEVVSLTGAFTGEAITIDATGFADFTKKVMTASDFETATITITNDPENKFGYQIVADGEGKALLITSDLVKDTYANAAWTPETQLGFVGDTALVWDGNAFNSAAAAAAKVSEGYTLYIEGGVFESAEAVTLEKNNDVVVKDDASIGALTTGGKLSVSKALVASSISGVSALSMVAGNNFSVSGGIALAADSTISIDVTNYNMEGDDAVVIATGEGITVGEAAIADAAITVTGEGAGAYHAYYNAEDKSVHLLRLNTFYLSSQWEGPDMTYIGPEYFDATGEKLIYNVNAFIRMNAAGAKMVDGMNFWAYHRNGSIHTGGPDMAEGEDGKFLNEVHVVGSTVDRLVIGGTTGEAVYVGDTKIFVEDSVIATSNDDDSWLVSNVTADNPWSHRNTLFGSITVDVKDSTIGTASNAGGTLRIINFTNVADRSETEKSSINVSFKDTEIYKAVRFLGDSPMGKDVEREEFSVSDQVADGGKGTTETLNIDLDNVKVGGAVEWAIRGGGARNDTTGGVVTVNMKDTTFGAQAIFAIEDNWNQGDINTDLPKCGSDFIFNVENTTINGYLVAGRRNYTSDLADLSVDSNGYGYSGKRVLNVIGSNTIKNALFFKEVNLTGDSSLLGDNLTLFNGNGLAEDGTMVHVDGTINVDLTGYTGAGRYLIATNFTYDDDGNITGGGIVNFDPAKSLVVKGLEEPAEGEEPAYTLVTDYNAETGTISTIVLKGGFTDIYVSSFYNEDDFDDVLGKAYTTGEAMFYGENAFSVMKGYEDPETGITVPGALDALKEGLVLHIAGGAIETDTLLNNAITIDAGATLAYQGDKKIVVDGTIQNNGNFVIDAAGFVAGSPDRVTILVADEILGNDIKVTTKAYAIEKALNEETGKTEIALVLKASDVFVNTAWVGEGYEPGAEVVIDGTTAYMGYTAFASADAALSKVNADGKITVISSDVSFTSPIARGVTVIVDSTSKISSTTVGSDTNAALVLKEGATGTALNVVGASTLTVEAGALVTGGLGMSANATVSFAAGSTLDFYIVGQTSIEGAKVTNLSSIGTSTPNFTVTIDAAMKEGTYQLATGAADFTSDITLKTETADIQVLALGEKVKIADFGAYFTTSVTDDGILTLTKENAQDVIFVDSAWTTGTVVVVDGMTVTYGENGFANGDDAVAKAVSSGASLIKVHGGAISFTDGITITTLVQSGATLANTNVTGTLTVSDGATVSGKATFAPAEGKTITVDGTIAFDTANATAADAQFVGLANVTGATKYTLTVTGDVASGDTFLLASGAEGFASAVALTGTTVSLTVGETQKVGDLGYTLVLDAGNLILNISDKPVPPIVYVNSTWTAAEGETVQISDTVTATMGYDAFKSGNPAYAAVASDGEIVVLGGSVSFDSAIAKTLTVNADATLTGKATFAADTVITINGTILFDTQYAAEAQIVGLANTNAAKFELVDSKSEAGTYVLASSVAGFSAGVKFGENTLTVGGEAVKIEDLTYTLSLSETNDLTLTVVKDEPPAPEKPETVYVNSAWTTEGAIVDISETVKATVGIDAFADYATAATKVADDGTIDVFGGEIGFDAMTRKTVVDADVTVTGKAAFTADTAITINGTYMFDTAIATATEAQLTGYSFVKGDVKFALSDAVGGDDDKTYLLATDAASFNKTITVSGEALTLEEGVRVNGYDYAIALDGANLVLTVKKYVKPTDLPTQVYVDVTWTAAAGETVTLADGVTTAKMDYDAFTSYTAAVSGVADNGTVTIDGHEITFTSVATGVNTEVGKAATLVGVNAFDNAITINGTIAFSTDYATATAAQITGFDKVAFGTDVQITITDAKLATADYVLADNVAGIGLWPTITVNGSAILINGDAVVIDDMTYTLATDDNALVLTAVKAGPGPQPTVPTKAFVNSEWAGLADGTVIAGATIGFDGFDTLAKAEAAETTEQAIEVVGGEINNFAGGFTKAITVDAGAKITGTAAFDKAITVNGTFVFDTTIATATTAQFSGFSFVSGTTTYELAVTTPVLGNYLLASDFTIGEGFEVAFGSATLTVGNTLTVGDYTYTLGYTENNVLDLTIGEKPVPPTPTETVYVNSAWAGLTDGTVVTVKEGVSATIGTDAFATGDKAAAAVAEDGKIEVVGGEVSFTDPITEPITIDEGATLTGKATFVSGATINGTLGFNTDDAQDGAQFTGFENVELGDDAQITLTVGELAAGAKVTLTDAPTDKTDKNKNPLYGKKISVTINGEDDDQYKVGSAYFAAADGISYVLDLDKNGQLVLTEVEQRLKNNVNDNLIVSKALVPEVAGENVPFTILTMENPEVFVDPEGEIKQTIENGAEKKTFFNFVDSKDDKIDYAQIVVEHGARLVFNLASTDKTKITLYSVSSNSKGQWSKKSLKSATATAGGNKNTAAVYVTGGTYYVAVSNANSKTSGAFYNVTLNTASSYIYADADDGWNNYLVKSKALNPQIAKIQDMETVITESTEAGNPLHIAFDDAPLTLDPTNSYENFVGYTDTVDFAKISATQPVALSLTLNATGKATLTVYKLTKSSNGVWTQSKALQTIKVTATAGGVKPGKTLYLDRLIGTAGAEATGYYVKVTSTNTKGNVNYNVLADAKVYEDSDFGTNGTLLTASKVPNDKLASTTIGKSSTPVTTEVLNGEDAIEVSKEYNDKTYTSFVGLGDQYDYAEVVLNGTGNLTLSLDTYGTTKSTAKVTLYKLTLGSKGTWSKSTVGKVLSVKTDGTYGLGSDSKTYAIKAATSDTVRYFVGIQSVDAAKGKEMYYNLSASFDGASSSALDMPQDDLLAQTFDSFANTASFVDSSLVDDKQFALQSVPGLIA